jgi:hypothetical protein
LVKLFCQVKLFQLKEQLSTIFHYYRNVRFALVDASIGLSAFFCNPYRVCRRFTGTHSYGETALSTFALIAKAVQLTKEDLFVDLGSARGKLCFWAALWIGCKVVGIEQVPSFMRKARRWAWLFRIPIRFDLGQMQTIDLSQATVVYLYAMEWEEAFLEQMKKGARLITVGAPAGEHSFEVIRVISAPYPWGVADVYIQRRL